MSGETQTQILKRGHNFGTFEGVFLPALLTIFGAIMFLRSNYVLGNVGIEAMFIILFLAASIMLSTALSISAISTNTPVMGGGAYFLISRTLGPEFGTAIGITLFLAQSLLIPFNILGFSEAVVNDIPFFRDYYFALNIVTFLLLLVLTWIGADWAIKFQYVIFGVLVAGILAFMLGALPSFTKETFTANLAPLPNTDMYYFFAIYFPAVTGILAGVNMSGDLKNPASSIPSGIIWAVVISSAVYALETLICGGAFSREVLIDKPYESLVSHALFGSGFLVFLGVAAATLSTALGLFLCAPRVLQALAGDRIMPGVDFFEKGSGPHNEPHRALLVSGVIGFIVIYWGAGSGISSSGMSSAMNIVASVATMFFLYTYAMINLAAFMESFGSNPSFRPRFKFFHWIVALYGGLACMAVSFLINFKTSLIAALLILLILRIVRHLQMEISFGDSRRGIIYSRIKDNLKGLARLKPDPKNWRPSIVILSRTPESQFFLLDFASLLGGRRGIITLVHFVSGCEKQDYPVKRQEALDKLSAMVQKHSYDNIFCEAVACPSMNDALGIFLQAHSIGPLKPNIAALNFPRERERAAEVGAYLRMILELNMSSIVFANFHTQLEPDKSFVKGHVDIWWRGMKNLSLMLILAYLLTSNHSWHGAYIRILKIVRSEAERESIENELKELVEESRIEAKVHIIVSDAAFDQIFRLESAGAALVFMGFVPPLNDEEAQRSYDKTKKILEGMPPTLLVSSTGEADLRV